MARSRLMERKRAWADSRARTIDPVMRELRVEARAAPPARRRELTAVLVVLQARRAAIYASIRDGRSPANREAYRRAMAGLDRAERRMLAVYGRAIGSEEQVTDELLARCDPRAVV